jgi:hypothetical protein
MQGIQTARAVTNPVRSLEIGMRSYKNSRETVSNFGIGLSRCTRRNRVRRHLTYATVLEARRRTLGKEHPGTLTRMNNLALTYLHQGKLQDAADLQEKELEARRRTLGKEHPGVEIDEVDAVEFDIFDLMDSVLYPAYIYV